MKIGHLNIFFDLMEKQVLETLIQFLTVLPILLFTLKDQKQETLKILFIFFIFFIFHSTILKLPLEVNALKLFRGNWNWTGKVFAIIGSLIFLALYRKFPLKDYHLTLAQKSRFTKKGIIILLVIFIIQSAFNFKYGTAKDWDLETILFQLTMPGIDEELAFRGIMLGLLVKILRPCSKTIFHPAILTTSILFGLTHGLFLNNSYDLIFRSYPFFNTFLIGMIWAWVTMKSGSILFALISHNLANTGSQLINMNK